MDAGACPSCPVSPFFWNGKTMARKTKNPKTGRQSMSGTGNKSASGEEARDKSLKRREEQYALMRKQGAATNAKTLKRINNAVDLITTHLKKLY
jgi:hypothetical protein